MTSLTTALADASAKERADYRWMLATMANMLRALGRDDEADRHERDFRAIASAGDIATFDEGKVAAIKLAAGRRS